MSSNDFLPTSPFDNDRPEMVLNLHDGSDEQVSVVVVHKDSPEYLNMCLQSIAIMTQNNAYELIVVDNGSGKDCHDFLDEIEHEARIKLIRNEKNQYWAKAANQGAMAASKNSKYLVFLHSDIVILNNTWVDLLANVAEMNHAGMVGVELSNYIIQGQKVDFVAEHCLLMTKDCWRDIGPFPVSLPQIGTSFIMTLKAQQKGYKPQVIKNQICWHFRVFGLSVNEYEVLSDQAFAEIPRLMREFQAIPVS